MNHRETPEPGIAFGTSKQPPRHRNLVTVIQSRRAHDEECLRLEHAGSRILTLHWCPRRQTHLMDLILPKSWKSCQLRREHTQKHTRSTSGCQSACGVMYLCQINFLKIFLSTIFISVAIKSRNDEPQRVRIVKQTVGRNAQWHYRQKS